MTASHSDSDEPAATAERGHPVLRWLRRSLVAGLLFWAPLLASVWVVRTLVATMDRSLVLLPPAWRPEALLGFPLPGLGLVLALLVLLVTGIVVANILGRRLVALGEAVVHRIPLVRSIYSAVKQLLETFLSTDSKSFRRVLLIEYPRKGLWTLAFQSGEAKGELQQKTERRVLTLFVPTAPNPTSGFVLLVPAEEVVELDMSVEEGLRMIISLGSVAPTPRAAAAGPAGGGPAAVGAEPDAPPPPAPARN